MLTVQCGKCAVCRAATVGCKGRKLFVDHCHITGKIRGLLCHNCNAGIGHFKDSKERLLLAIRYIEDHENG